MRDDVPGWVLTESHRVRTYVDALFDGEVIAADLPLDSGTLEVTADSPVPGRLDLTFPSELAPRGWRDPLAVYGQRLAVRQLISVPGHEYTIELGQYRVQSWQHQRPAVDVEAYSLEQLISDYRFDSPYQRPSGATFASTLRDVCAGLLPVDTSAMTDRTLPASLTSEWEVDRISAVGSLATAWPCDLRVDVDGVLVASPVRTTGTPVVTWRHGEADAYVDVGGSGLRSEMFNGVVARGEAPDGTPVQASRVDDNPASPTYFYGPFGRRQRFYESPLITTRAQASSAAATVLARELRRRATVEVTAPPDPRVEVLDTAAVTLEDGTTYTGPVLELALPLTPADGAATYVVGVDTW